MNLQIRKILFAFTAVSTLTLFVTTSFASPPASRDFPGYWRVTYKGQDVFCDKELDGHFLRLVCHTRKEMEKHEQAVLVFDTGPALLSTTAQAQAAGRPGM